MGNEYHVGKLFGLFVATVNGQIIINQPEEGEEAWDLNGEDGLGNRSDLRESRGGKCSCLDETKGILS